jgi:hypothetical protein
MRIIRKARFIRQTPFYPETNIGIKKAHNTIGGVDRLPTFQAVSRAILSFAEILGHLIEKMRII